MDIIVQPAITDKNDTNNIGTVQSQGVIDPCAIRRAATVMGISCIEDVFKTTSIAIFRRLFSQLSRCFMAFIPSGVAALPSPKDLLLYSCRSFQRLCFALIMTETID